jgi:hypothetical protein
VPARILSIWSRAGTVTVLQVVRLGQLLIHRNVGIKRKERNKGPISCVPSGPAHILAYECMKATWIKREKNQEILIKK